jgi:hypothetical protein
LVDGTALEDEKSGGLGGALGLASSFLVMTWVVVAVKCFGI